MDKLLLVFLGGGAGAVARYGVGALTKATIGTGWPYNTFAVNVIGGFLMGVLVTTLAVKGVGGQDRWLALLGVGVLGGFTTFSAYSLEVAKMIETRAYASAAIYASLSVVLAIAALFAAMALTRRILA